MTEYRKISNGHWNFLQYKREYKFLWIKWHKWCYVWKPYYDKYWGRSLDPTMADGFVSDLDWTDLDRFVQHWPNIADYFAWAKVKQEELEVAAIQQRLKVEEKRGQITPSDSP